MKKISLIVILVLASALLVVAGCNKDGATTRKVATTETPAQEAAPAAAAPAADASMWSGTVAETMDAGGYTYVLLDRGADKIWVAGPQTTVKVGDAIVMSPGMAMNNFESKTLERTFDVIYFVGGFEMNDGHSHAEGGMPAEHPGGGSEHPAAGSGMGMAMGGDAASHMATARETVEGVTKAAGGNTVAEIFTGAAGLKDKTVKVRGRVVKFTANVMGTNWIHIQDGTGADGTHDLTVTTSATAKVGDVVLVEGPLSVDRDFGAGYRYPVIIEGATVVVE
ncbi:MAG TPA: nucleotide-binding protein [Candidatus Krumholzibacteria bacterium]|nr:nucleotide-binding protein [Candidatus Krumholzibacteria bacterium]